MRLPFVTLLCPSLHACSPALALTYPHPLSRLPLQYQRNYFVSWDSVYSAADALLLGLGVGPSPGVDLEWQAAAFRDTWLKGGWGGWGGWESQCRVMHGSCTQPSHCTVQCDGAE